MSHKVIAFTEFRKNASQLITEVGRGESLVIFRHGKPIAKVIPYSDETEGEPSWKQPGLRLQIPGADITSAILQERDESL
jgi:prevent-host-death family protein